METGTVYSYLLNSIDKPDLYDIRALSSDFMTRLSSELVDTLNKEVGISMRRAIKPKNDAQMHAYIYGNIIRISHEIERLMLDKDRGYDSIYDYSIIDYDCGVGLSTIALIHLFKEKGWDLYIKEIILVDDNVTCLQRAELLTKSMLPKATVKVVQKRLKELVVEDVHTEHMMTYHLLCSDYNTVDKSFTKRFINENRYLFSTIIFKKRSLDYDALYPLQFSLYETNDEGYGIAKQTDISTITAKQSAESPFDNLSLGDDSLRNSDSKNYDQYYDKVSSFIKNKERTHDNYYNFFKNLAEKSILAKYNLSLCLAHGIGCIENRNEAVSLLKQLTERTEGKFKAKIIKTLAYCVNDLKETIYLYRQAISLINDENEKCAARTNLAHYLRRDGGNEHEVECLYRQCIEYGCINCEEASRYDDTKRSCPRAQYSLSYILEEQGEKDIAFHLMQAAANQGFIYAVNDLAVYYANGKYVAKDMAKAIELYSEAADAGNLIAQKNLFRNIKKENPVKAFWYLTLACNSKDTEAQEMMLEFLPKVVSGQLQEDLNNYWIVLLAEEGVKKYQDHAVDILVRDGDRLMNNEDIDEARKQFERIAQFDKDLSEKKLQELEDNTSNWYYEREDNFYESYSYHDSMMDALDGDPSAYWNIE